MILSELRWGMKQEQVFNIIDVKTHNGMVLRATVRGRVDLSRSEVDEKAVVVPSLPAMVHLEQIGLWGKHSPKEWLVWIFANVGFQFSISAAAGCSEAEVDRGPVAPPDTFFFIARDPLTTDALRIGHLQEVNE